MIDFDLVRDWAIDAITKGLFDEAHLQINLAATRMVEIKLHIRGQEIYGYLEVEEDLNNLTSRDVINRAIQSATDFHEYYIQDGGEDD